MLILFYFIRQSTADCLNRSGYALPKFNMCIITNSILNKIAEIQEKSQQRKLKQGKDNGNIFGENRKSGSLVSYTNL